ncbi:MAG: tRNA 2-thiouridine(34) synthase MnmA [Firmicutes bacterium]|nr:tRNA 2-thiouridine(34) synthase MnmA [Bacillota bacterium]
MSEKKKVIIGMSGGVDSSVAAAILLEKGYDVIGVTMQIWPDREKDDMKGDTGCCSLSAVEDARKVADKLSIPYYVMNFKNVFKEKVIDYFVNEYLEGRTPNPCIVCNRHIKFEVLLNKALSMGIDYIATGHYARVEYDEDIDRYLLKKAVNPEKDQSYVLYKLTQEQLSRILLPIGEYTKDEVRKIAEKYKLPVAKKPDSQEICFINDNDYGKFICDYTDSKILPGYFVDTEGNILGKHKGIIHYTVGQRRGLGIALGKPMYVVEIDTKNNRVVLGDINDVLSRTLIADDLNFISIPGIDREIRVNAKIRYTAKEAPATIYPLERDKVKVEFDSPQRAITPGQSVVFYDEEVVVGGGVIISSDKNYF